MRLDLRLQRLELGGGSCAGGAGELRELQLRRKLLAKVGEQVDVGLAERRAVGGVDDQRADRPVGESKRHDRGGAQRALGMTARDP